MLDLRVETNECEPGQRDSESVGGSMLEVEWARQRKKYGRGS